MLFPWYEPFFHMRFATSITCVRLPESAVCFLVSGCLCVVIVTLQRCPLRFDVALSRGLLTFVSQPI